MKLILLIAFLLLSLALPMIVILKEKKDAGLMYVTLGALIYVVSSCFSNFMSLAVGLNDLATYQNKLIYVVIMSLSMSITLFLFSKINNAYKKGNELIFGGFSLVNLFINNMNSYLVLVLVGLNHSTEKLEKFYPQDIASNLIKYYDAIGISNLILLIIEMILVFMIMKKIFNIITKEDTKVINYVFFLVGIFILFFSQYCISNSFVTFIIYLCLIFVMYRHEIKVLK